MVTVTDFNEDIARATLLERPNSFFVGTVAPEDIDSDSGYSSPQHRQTTAVPSDTAKTAATAAAAIPVVVGPPPVVVPPSLQSTSRIPGAPQPALMTCMPDGGHMPVIYGPYSFQSPPPVNMFFPPPVGPNYPDSAPRPRSVNYPINCPPRMRYRALGNRKASKQQAVMSKLPTDNQPTCVNAEASSQVAACSEPALPFDDVDEFPYLLSAADGLVASQATSGPSPNPVSTYKPAEVIEVDILLAALYWCLNASLLSTIITHSTQIHVLQTIVVFSGL